MISGPQILLSHTIMVVLYLPYLLSYWIEGYRYKQRIMEFAKGGDDYSFVRERLQKLGYSTATLRDFIFNLKLMHLCALMIRKGAKMDRAEDLMKAEFEAEQDQRALVFLRLALLNKDEKYRASTAYKDDQGNIITENGKIKYRDSIQSSDMEVFGFDKDQDEFIGKSGAVKNADDVNRVNEEYKADQREKMEAILNAVLKEIEEGIVEDPMSAISRASNSKPSSDTEKTK